MRKLIFILLAALCVVACNKGNIKGWASAGECEINDSTITLHAGSQLTSDTVRGNFRLSVQCFMHNQATGTVRICTDGESGYSILLHNGPQDGTRKTGSLLSVRNLYRSLVQDGEWFDLSIAVRGKNISVSINGTDVVCYTEPENPYRIAQHAQQVLGDGCVIISSISGEITLKNIELQHLGAEETNPADSLSVIDEQNDSIIRLQQRDFPLVDWHVHLKGGLTKEQAHAMSLNYGINYGVAPNAGEGGVGRMLANNEEVIAYLDEVRPLPFLCGVQGEGRRWTQVFSLDTLAQFDYLFTDAMTIIDADGCNARIYRPEEVHYTAGKDAYMQQIVDQTCLILNNEPADIFANATYIPEDMQEDYDTYWTDERINAVLDVMQLHGIAMEINARYRIPSKKIISMAKERGLKFTFGTNNVDADFGRLEYCIECIRDCGLTINDLWWPTMSTRKDRKTIIYNDFSQIKMQY